VEALGLDLALTHSVSITADWAQLTLVNTDEHGAPIVELGRLTTRSVGVPIAASTAAT
jgi:hypothetical protein